jgi:hypothetical protein
MSEGFDRINVVGHVFAHVAVDVVIVRVLVIMASGQVAQVDSVNPCSYLPREERAVMNTESWNVIGRSDWVIGPFLDVIHEIFVYSFSKKGN